MASKIIAGSTLQVKDKGSGTQNSGNLQFSISSLCISMRKMLPFFFFISTYDYKYKQCQVQTEHMTIYDQKYLTPVSGKKPEIKQKSAKSL